MCIIIVSNKINFLAFFNFRTSSETKRLELVFEYPTTKMTSPIHGRNRFGFHPASSPSPILSPVVGKFPARFTPSPTKLESPKNLLNNNQADNGNVVPMKTNANVTNVANVVAEKNGRNQDKSAGNCKATYLCLKSDYSEDVHSKAEFKQLLQIGGEFDSCLNV